MATTYRTDKNEGQYSLFDRFEASIRSEYADFKRNLLSYNLMELNGHQAKEFIAECEFDDSECLPLGYEFTSSPSELYGNCFTYNSRLFHNVSLKDEIIYFEDNYSHMSELKKSKFKGQISKFKGHISKVKV